MKFFLLDSVAKCGYMANYPDEWSRELFVVSTISRLWKLKPVGAKTDKKPFIVT